MVGRGWTDETSGSVALFGAILGVVSAFCVPFYALFAVTAAAAFPHGPGRSVALAAAVLSSAAFGLPAMGLGRLAHAYAREDRFVGEGRSRVARTAGRASCAIGAAMALILAAII